MTDAPTFVAHLPVPSGIHLYGPFPALKEWREGYAVAVDGAEYSQAFRKGDWDGLARPGTFRKVEGLWRLELGRGWLERVVAAFPGLRVDVGYDAAAEPMDLSAIPAEVRDQLRDYQWDALHAAAARRWGRVALATNAGKGAIIALTAVAVRGRTLILADEIAVFQALADEIEAWADEPIGLVEAGADDPPEERVVLAMVPTLRSRLKSAGGTWDGWFASFTAVLCDEADRATAAGWKKVLHRCVSSHVRLGFSGSFPDEGTAEDLAMWDAFGPTLIEVRNMELVDRGISAQPLVELIPYRARRIPDPPCEDGCACARGWRGMDGPARRTWVYDHAITANADRHALVRAMLDDGEPNAVIVNRIAHGEALEAAIPGSVFLHGSHGKDERDAVLSRFRDGAFRTLIATKILDRGTNMLGHAVGLVFASGEGSPRQVLQRVGRGLRRAGGKEFVYLRDIVDSGHRYLERAATRRVGVYRDEGFEITVRR